MKTVPTTKDFLFRSVFTKLLYSDHTKCISGMWMMMKTINYAAFLFTLLLVQQEVFSYTSLEPFLYRPGKASILVFLDLHRSYHDGTCSDTDWNVFELARSLHWKANQENITGCFIILIWSGWVADSKTYSNVKLIVKRSYKTCLCNDVLINDVWYCCLTACLTLFCTKIS